MTESISIDTRIFAYGSLIWRPDFAYLDRQAACLHGWERRFWQASTDHRGTPEQPGRVATLIAVPGARCHGVVYTLPAAEAEAVLVRLDHRESGGYARQWVEVELADGSRVDNVLTYHATADNPHYIGPEPAAATAAVICRSIGPSGRNLDYLLNLSQTLAELGFTDAHVEELVFQAHTSSLSELDHRGEILARFRRI